MMRLPPNKRIWQGSLLVILTLFGIIGGLPTSYALRDNDLRHYVTECQDMEASLFVSKLDTKELEKIGKDFATTYRLRNLTLYYQSPDKIRLESTSRVLGDALLILDGNTRFYAISRLNIRKKEDLSTEPSKRQSLLEYGALLSQGTFDFMESSFVKEEDGSGSTQLIYDLKYKKGGTSSYRIWLDPKTRLIRKRVWFDTDHKIRATFLYQEPREMAPNLWLPSTCEIQNATGVTAAIIDFKSVKVNQGLAKSLFEIMP